VTQLGPETKGAVVIGGSHAAIYTTYLTVKAGALAAIQHDAGIGRDAAGVGGLGWSEQYRFAMAAVAASSARIGDGADMLRRGIISRANRFAQDCGVAVGMSCAEAAERLRRANPAVGTPDHFSEARAEIVLDAGRPSVVVVDSLALCQKADRGRVACTGSHGGAPSFGYAMKFALGAVLFNDAAFGADDSGTAALPPLNENGIAAIAVSAFTARIGDGRSTLNDGVISAANDLALSIGAEIGGTALHFARRALNSSVEVAGSDR
jgi:hypothetical protein